jgi:DNA-binding response OmpR family regulator
MLPDIDGWEIYRQMKDDDELVHVPVIIISARDEQRDAKAGHHVIGDDRYLKKPFEIDDLVNTVYEVIEKHPVT